MKSSVIPKEESGKYRIESFYTDLSSLSSSSIVDKLLNLPEEIGEEEKQKIDQILEIYFLRKDESKELSRKFVDFFETELKKSLKIPPSKKFVDFLIAKKIAGSYSRKRGNVIDSVDSVDVKPLDITSVIEGEATGFPRIIRDENGDVIGIDVKCKCGEIIHIDLEYEQ